MNLTTVAMLLLAWQLLKKGDDKKDGRKNVSPTDALRSVLNDDTKNLIDTAQKLGDPNSSVDDRTGALLNLATNPAFMSFAGNLFGGGNEKADDPDVNDEGFRFEKPSEAAREFFRPVENVAGKEASHKLYEIYDNWYGRKR